MFKRSAFTYGRGVFANKADVLKNPKQDILFRSLNKELLEHHMVITTGAKAKFINSHFYKIVNKVKEYKNVEKGSERQKALILEAKSLLIGNNNDDALKTELLKKVEALMARWSKRITENTKTDRFLNISRLEPRKYDASPMCLVELKDLPLFNELDLPTYGNLYIWLTLEGLMNPKIDTVQKKSLFTELYDYMKTLSEEERTSFFEKDLIKVRKHLAKRDFDATNEINGANKEAAEDDETKLSEEFTFDSSAYTELNSKLEADYNHFVKAMKKKEASKPKADVRDLGKVNKNARSNLSVISNFDY